ncbi:MAG: hypothetical protein E7401_03205 [Ruminococcaceae bacterium]|nr:hypothetical protein [Oscillospiraceae bacterium]
MKITLKKQGQTGKYKFNGQIYYTKGIESEFGDMTFKLIAETLQLIKKLVDTNTADYFQVAIADMEDGRKIKVYVIDDVTHITFLLPSEY